MQISQSVPLIFGLALVTICVIEFGRALIPYLYTSAAHSIVDNTPTATCVSVIKQQEDLLQKAIDRQFGRSTDPKRTVQFKKRDAILVAMVSCQPNDCPRKFLNAYKETARKYVQKRQNDVQTFYKWEGSDGVYKVREFYDTQLDDRIVAGLQARYQAGLIGPADFRQRYRDAAAILIKGTRNRFPTCTF